MAFSSRVWGLGKALLLLGTLGATYLLFFALSMRLANSAREVAVPLLVGRTVNQARAMADDQGLALRVEEARRDDAKVAAGRVVAQDPPAGRTARRQRTVKVWLSAGPATTTAPAVIGESERTARMRLQAAGVELASVAEVRSDEAPPDVVVAQVPEAGARTSQVAVLVNRAAESRRHLMPDLIGTSGARAAEVLRQLGFRVSVVGEQPYPGVGPGTVLRQHPQAGFQVTPGQAISLEVSR